MGRIVQRQAGDRHADCNVYVGNEEMNPIQKQERKAFNGTASSGTGVATMIRLHQAKAEHTVKPMGKASLPASRTWGEHIGEDTTQ